MSSFAHIMRLVRIHCAFGIVLICLRQQNLDLLEPHNLVPPGVFTLDGLLRYGEEHKQCPYFSARRMVILFSSTVCVLVHGLTNFLLDAVL